MERNEKKIHSVWKILTWMCLDCILIAAVSVGVLWARFEFVYSAITPKYLDYVYRYMPVNLLITLGVFWLFRIYKSLWRFAGIRQVCDLVLACMVSTILSVTFIMEKMIGHMPRSYKFYYVVFLMFAMVGSRVGYRILYQWLARKKSGPRIRTMIIGAGDATRILLEEMQRSRFLSRKICCLIDDDSAKHGTYFLGYPIVGGREAILAAAEKYQIEEIIISMPSVSKKVIRQIVDICKESGCRLKTLPGLYQLVNEEVSITKLREVQIEDLLGRESVHVDLQEIMGYVSGKVILVTGGGGSIGSELCRQLAAHGPKQLILVDIYENSAYEIEQELRRKYPGLDLVVLIASVRNTHRMNQIFEDYRPEIVYHAAAHKHVPLMEGSPNEAIKNNVFGTYKTALAAANHGVKRFVLISTDKAVNPTNIMGASKRICEMLVQTLNQHYPTEFVAVRFGNVLGSNGSVIPLFRKQIEEGGPVTVTHPDIIRYFMTIPEAVSLVLQAGAYAKGGEIFILDMGEPVRILDLAENLIRLSGYIPGEEIEIQFVGLRPGEKLYEEILMEEEGLKETKNQMIYIGQPIEMDEERFLEKVEKLGEAAMEDAADIRELVKELVPTYHPEAAGETL
jgi:FlaA1/EpsC-like NDP-sugar epimerase